MFKFLEKRCISDVECKWRNEVQLKRTDKLLKIQQNYCLPLHDEERGHFLTTCIKRSGKQPEMKEEGKNVYKLF